MKDADWPQFHPVDLVPTSVLIPRVVECVTPLLYAQRIDGAHDSKLQQRCLKDPVPASVELQLEGVSDPDGEIFGTLHAG